MVARSTRAGEVPRDDVVMDAVAGRAAGRVSAAEVIAALDAAAWARGEDPGAIEAAGASRGHGAQAHAVVR